MDPKLKTENFLFFGRLKAVFRGKNALKMFGETSVIPRNANVLFLHGKNDPVLHRDYMAKFVSDVKTHQSPGLSFTEKVLENQAQWDTDQVHQAIQKLYELSVCQKVLIEQRIPVADLWKRQQAELNSVIETLTGSKKVDTPWFLCTKWLVRISPSNLITRLS